MATYEIQNSTSGAILGTYEAASPEAALDLMAKDAGYDSQAQAVEVTDDGKDLIVRKVSE